MVKRALFTALVSVFFISACTETTTQAVSQNTTSTATSGQSGAWSSYISAKQGKTSSVPPITLTKAVSICREILRNGGDIKPIVERDGPLPGGWKHTGQPNGRWLVAQNKYAITSVAAFYDRAGKVRNITYFTSGSPKFSGGLQYWMEMDEACKPGVLHSDRPRIAPTSDAGFPFPPPS